MVPSNAVLDRAVDPTDLIIVTWIVCDADNQGWHELNWSVLCSRFHLHHEAVANSLKKLIELGYLRAKITADDPEQWMLQININPHRKIEGYVDPRYAADDPDATELEGSPK